jgi:hypothetical protein|tara:strand:- start:725 stop:1129 length:405 start_codon:yes stop_codon:yes gene_type:complete
MADTKTSQTLQDGDRIAVMKFTDIYVDGGDESAVNKVIVANLQSQSGSGAACTGVSIECVWYECSGVSVDMLWEATADVLAWSLSGYGYFDFRSAGPLTNNSGSGKTGNIAFTTVGLGSGDRYSVMLKLSKSYE